MKGHRESAPLVLVVLDGWGVAKPGPYNAVTQAAPLFFDELVSTYPSALLSASEEAVGLPKGVFGNSEVGHLNLGAGRVVYQDLLRINQAITNGDFFKNPKLLAAATKVQTKGGAWHLMGLASSGCVHSSLDHLFALLETAKRLKVPKVYLHLFLDGRDTPYNSGLKFIEAVEQKCQEYKVGQIATVSGRFYAMDRDNHWERIALAYEAIAKGSGPQFNSASEAIKASYRTQVYDEELKPVVTKGGAPVQDGDVIIFFNYRADRARELSRVFTDKSFKPKEFKPQNFKNLDFISFTDYDSKLPLKVIFPPLTLKNCLGEVLAKHQKRQVRIAETEKYAHVTYFFNGGVEKPFALEDRLLIPSPRVASYATKPSMSAYQVADKAVKSLQSKKYDFILVNFANADMVGHTGSVPAAIKGIQAADRGLKRIVKNTLALGGTVLVTADHGNADSMYDVRHKSIVKEHSLNPVPFIKISSTSKLKTPNRKALYNSPIIGALSDVAPTVLNILGIKIPKEMTGKILK